MIGGIFSIANIARRKNRRGLGKDILGGWGQPFSFSNKGGWRQRRGTKTDCRHSEVHGLMVINKMKGTYGWRQSYFLWFVCGRQKSCGPKKGETKIWVDRGKATTSKCTDWPITRSKMPRVYSTLRSPGDFPTW